MTWLCVGQICYCLSRCYSASFTKVWEVECNTFETFLNCLPLGDPRVHWVFMKNGKESTLTDYHSFQDLSAKFSYSKAIHVFSFFLSLYKCRKRLSMTTLMSLNWEIMDQTMPTIIHVSWRKLLGARVAPYQQEFCRKFTPSEQMYFFQACKTIPRKYISNFTGTEKTQLKSSCIRFYFLKFEAFEVCFLGLQ